MPPNYLVSTCLLCTSIEQQGLQSSSRKNPLRQVRAVCQTEPLTGPLIELYFALCDSV